MKQLVIRLQRLHLKITETERKNGQTRLNRVRVFPLPDDLKEGAFTAAPEKLAAFLREALTRGRLTDAPLVLMFDAPAALTREYHHQKLSGGERFRRARLEAEAALPAGAGGVLIENRQYGTHENQNGLRISAIDAIPEEFLRKLTAELKQRGLRCRYAGASMAVLSDTAALLLRTLAAKEQLSGKNVIVLELEEDAIRLLLLANARLIHQSERILEGGAPDQETLLHYVQEQVERALVWSEHPADREKIRLDYILAAGHYTGQADCVSAMAGKLNIPCRTFADFAAELSDVFDLSEELAGRKNLYSQVILLAGPLSRIGKKGNFLYGGIVGEREKKRTIMACSVILAVVLAALAVLPVYSFQLQERCRVNNEIIQREQYAEARALIAEKKQLTTELQTCEAEKEYLNKPEVSLSAFLYQASRSLFAGSVIQSMDYAGNGGGIHIQFLTPDSSAFLLAKEKWNRQERIRVLEPMSMEVTESGAWKCTLTMSWQEEEEAK